MKKTFTLILAMLLFVVSSVSSQETNNTHLEFMGIPITGNVDFFSKSLTAKGFTKEINPNNDGTLMLSGKFTNREVMLGLVSSEKTNDIYRVGVLYEPQTSWELLSNHYDYLVDLFTKKYGSPKESIKELDSVFDDSHHIMGFKLEKSKYSTYWSLSNGNIQIFINAISSDSAIITIIYEDAVGAQSLSDESLDDI